MFVLQNLELPAVQANGVSFIPHRLEERLTRFDLVFQAWENEGGMLLWVTYANSLFRRETVERLAADYRLLLEQLADDPQLRIGQLRLNEREREKPSAKPAFDFEF